MRQACPALHECGNPHVDPKREHNAQQNQGGESVVSPAGSQHGKAVHDTTCDEHCCHDDRSIVQLYPPGVGRDQAHDRDNGEQKRIGVSDSPGHGEALFHATRSCWIREGSMAS